MCTITVPHSLRGPHGNLVLKIFSMVVVLLMVVAMIYGGVMALMYWSGIGV